MSDFQSLPPDLPSDLPPAPDLSSTFWEGRYQEGTARWDLGQPAPPFVTLLNGADAPKPGRMIVLGSGRGHDALLFAAHGFEVVGIDFAPSAIATATTTAEAQGLSAQFLQRDIFALGDEFANGFDYVLEHTCYCAIAPDQRSDYVRLVHKLLRPHGELIALFWAHSRPGGPPFGTTPDELRQRFAAEFALKSFDLVTNSVADRRNEEYLVRVQAIKSDAA
jgi:SAM-dependent methyltransferase